MRHLELTPEDMADLIAKHTINVPLDSGEEIIVAAPDGVNENWGKETNSTPDRIRESCGCGMEIVWTGEGWQHDCAPYFHGDDHFIDNEEPDPEDPARKYWDIEDGVRDEEEN
jgi:hypothetical protein